MVFKVLPCSLSLLEEVLQPCALGFSVLGSFPEHTWIRELGRGHGAAQVAPPLALLDFPKGGSIQCSLLLPLKYLQESGDLCAVSSLGLPASCDSALHLFSLGCLLPLNCLMPSVPFTFLSFPKPFCGFLPHRFSSKDPPASYPTTLLLLTRFGFYVSEWPFPVF